MPLKPIGFLEEMKDGSFLVGARDDAADYTGPVARVEADENWLWISTDDHEGTAMLNVESLPVLRRALSRLGKQLKASGAAD